MGIVIMLAAGVFTALPVYFDLFAYQWYYALCWFWFLLGVALLVFGIAHEACCTPAKAREIDGAEEDGSGPISAPTPYIMIN